MTLAGVFPALRQQEEDRSHDIGPSLAFLTAHTFANSRLATKQLHGQQRPTLTTIHSSNEAHPSWYSRFIMSPAQGKSSEAPASTKKTFGKTSREVPHHSQKAKKWYPAEDESVNKKVGIVVCVVVGCRRDEIWLEPWLASESSRRTCERYHPFPASSASIHPTDTFRACRSARRSDRPLRATLCNPEPFSSCSPAGFAASE